MPLPAVLLAWLVGLAYFLLTASAGGVTSLQLNPAADLSGRICHALLPIPNKVRLARSAQLAAGHFGAVGSQQGPPLPCPAALLPPPGLLPTGT